MPDDGEAQCKELAKIGWAWHTGTHQASHHVGDINVVAEFDFDLDAFAVSIPDIPSITGHVGTAVELEEWVRELKSFVVSGMAPDRS